ncbi:DUF1931 family protein [Streptomyces hirsutus]
MSKFERFFRAAAGLDVDKNDLKRYGDFVDAKLYDLLVVGQASAKVNDRDTVEPWDLPITKGLQESVHGFRRLDEEVELKPILEQLAAHPPPRQDTRSGDRRALPREHRRSQRRPRRDVQNHISGRQEPADQPLGGRYLGVRPAAVAIAPRCMSPD